MTADKPHGLALNPGAPCLVLKGGKDNRKPLSNPLRTSGRLLGLKGGSFGKFENNDFGSRCDETWPAIGHQCDGECGFGVK